MTEGVKESIRERINSCIEQVMGSSDPEYDRFLKGMVHAFNEVLAVKLSDVKSIEENDEIQT